MDQLLTHNWHDKNVFMLQVYVLSQEPNAGKNTAEADNKHRCGISMLICLQA